MRKDSVFGVMVRKTTGGEKVTTSKMELRYQPGVKGGSVELGLPELTIRVPAKDIRRLLLEDRDV